MDEKADFHLVVAQAISLEREGRVRRADDILLDLILGWLEDDPELLNACLPEIRLADMGTHLLVCLLTAMAAPKARGLAGRPALLERVRTRLTELAPARVERLMGSI